MAMKQVIVVRKDLNMRKGKIASQVAHASLGAVLRESYDNELTYNDQVIERQRIIRLSPELDEWLSGPFTKVVVSVDSLEELEAIYKKAKKEKIITCMITDAGKTEFNGVPTITCAAIGPGRDADIDKITGHLKLL